METTTTTWPEEQAGELEREYAAWDWVRTAGVSAEELRAALKEGLRGCKGCRYREAA